MKNNNKNNDNNKKKGKIITGILIILLLLSLTVIYLYNSNQQNKETTEFIQNTLNKDISSSALKKGGLTEEDVKVLAEEMQRNTDASKNEYSGPSAIVIEKDGLANLLLENQELNNTLFQFSVVETSTKKLIYQSPPMEPNTSIGKDYVSEMLPRGIYEGTIFIYEYDMNTEMLLGIFEIGTKLVFR